MTFVEWMTATYISSKEHCGEDLSHVDSLLELNPTQMINHKAIEWVSIMRKPRIYCNDGFYMSVQGASGMYSSPRKTVEIYDSMEIGYPSEEISEIDSDGGGIYGYVLVKTIQEIIDNHGGINIKKSLSGLTNKNSHKWIRNLKLKRILNEN